MRCVCWRIKEWSVAGGQWPETGPTTFDTNLFPQASRLTRETFGRPMCGVGSPAHNSAFAVPDGNHVPTLRSKVYGLKPSLKPPLTGSMCYHRSRLYPPRTITDSGSAPMLIIDCHAHIYGEDEKKYPTIEKPYRPPAGKGTVAHLKQEMSAAGVKYVTAIQTSTYYRWDNRFTADSSKANREFMVGVVTLDPDDVHSPGMLQQYIEHFNVRGMRSIPAKSGKLDDPGVDALWQTAEEQGSVINVLVNRDKLGEIESLLKRHPNLRIVIDHCFNIRADGDVEADVAAMRTMAKHKNAHAKLTFIPTGSAQELPCEDLYAPCRAFIKAFCP